MRQFELGGYKLQLNDTNFETRMHITSLFSDALKKSSIVNLTTATFAISSALGFNLYLVLMPIIYREGLLSIEKVKSVDDTPTYAFEVIKNKEQLVLDFPVLDKYWGAFVFEVYNEYAKECTEGLGKSIIENFTEFMGTPTTQTTTSELN